MSVAAPAASGGQIRRLRAASAEMPAAAAANEGSISRPAADAVFPPACSSHSVEPAMKQ